MWGGPPGHTSPAPWCRLGGTDLHASFGSLPTCFDAATRQRLLANQSAWCLVAESVLQGRIPIAPELLQRAICMYCAN